jgi:hypothetical protein
MEKRACILFSAVFMVSAVAMADKGGDGGKLKSSSPAGAEVTVEQKTAEVLSKFIVNKNRQMQEIARKNRIMVSPRITAFVQAMQKGESWKEVSVIFKDIQSRSGQYKQGTRDLRIHSALWSGPVIEMGGGYEIFNKWNPALLDLYATELISVIPDGSVYFGGTDPGRFAITPYLAARENNKTIIITQNALADNTYMDYLHAVYDGKISLPARDDISQMFSCYIDRVRLGKLPKDSGIKIKDGKVKITGVKAIMAINGMIAQNIFDSNKDKYRFFVEESYVISWMRQYLEPCGMIMALNSEPVTLTDEAIAANDAYWQKLIQKLKAISAFETDVMARKVVSKARTSIGRLYVFHKKYTAAEHAFKEAIMLSPANDEPTIQLAQMYFDAGKSNEARKLLIHYITFNPGNKTVPDFMGAMSEKQKQSK